MSLPDPARNRRAACRIGAALFSTMLTLAVLTGCTVRPLYSTQGGVATTPSGVALSSIAVKPVTTREAQQVRNQLIFLFNGGGSEPAAPAYSLDLGVISRTRSTAHIQRILEEEPTAGTVTMVSNYKLTDTATGTVVASGRRQTMASFDRPRQEFAAYRAERDAQDRAARELAEVLSLAVAQDIERIHR